MKFCTYFAYWVQEWNTDYALYADKVACGVSHEKTVHR